jgi:glycosyltransferase involved in cell wall biosynthesis
MTPKKIIIFIPSIEGYGVEKNLYIITNFLAKHFSKIVLITSSRRYKDKFNNRISLLTPKSYFWRKGGRLRKYFICSLLLINYLLNNKNTLVFSFQANLYSTLISKLMCSKIIIRLNSAPVGWSKNLLKKYIFKILFSFADRIIVNSLEFKKEIKNKFNINSTCIYNPLNKKEIFIKSKIKTKKIYSKEKSLKIINVGRLVEQKNQILLLKAIKYLAVEKKINLELVIIGDGEMRSSLLNFISSNKLKNTIKIKKFNSNPFNLITQADLFVLSSKFEGLPNVLLEAIVLKRFVISTNCPTGPKEILLNGKAGLLCKTNDYVDLTSKILFYLNNKKKCQKMLLLAQKNLNRFDYNKNLNTYLKILNNLK